ncbi:unnamed protein product [Staurois parvus]|uniref:Secreted protein n=1 Tax=Staurois parvus TaxID=386267 RepID=A0ABN9GEN1_9NEOB|nr:unnamed protein product [Staurois parvus]
MCVFVVCSRCWVPVLNLGLCFCSATLPWAPVPPPLAAARSRACVWPSIEAASAPPLCHWTLDSRLPTLLLGGTF